MPHSSPRGPASIANQLILCGRNDGQLGEAGQHEPVTMAPVQRGGGDGEVEFGEPVQQRPGSEPALRTRLGG